jgi:acetyl/propionyl-CoA carboxylase alpha subunit
MNISLFFAGQEFSLRLRERGHNHMQVVMNGETFDIDVEYFSSEEYLLKIDGKVYDVIVSPNSDSYAVCINGKNIHVGKKSPFQILGGKGSRSERREVKTSMPGRIIEVLAQEGDEVEEGQAVLILEAMKMQNEIKSPQPGKIACLGPKTGDSVAAGALLFVIE